MNLTPQTPAAQGAEKAAQAAFAALSDDDREGQWLLLAGMSDAMQAQRAGIHDYLEAHWQDAHEQSERGQDWLERFDAWELRAGWYHGFLGTYGPTPPEDLDFQLWENVRDPMVYGGDPGAGGERVSRPDGAEGIRLFAELQTIIAAPGDPPPPPEQPELWERMLSVALQYLVDHYDESDPGELALAERVTDALTEGEAKAGNKYGAPWGSGSSFLPALIAGGLVIIGGLWLAKKIVK